MSKVTEYFEEDNYRLEQRKICKKARTNKKLKSTCEICGCKLDENRSKRFKNRCKNCVDKLAVKHRVKKLKNIKYDK